MIGGDLSQLGERGVACEQSQQNYYEFISEKLVQFKYPTTTKEPLKRKSY